MKKQAEVRGKRPNGKKKRVYATGRVKKIKGQKHKLAWINDNEENLLRARNKSLGGPEAVKGPQGILAYPEPGVGNAPDGPGMGYGGGAKGANAAAAGSGGGTGGGKGNANAGGGFGGSGGGGSSSGGGADRGGGNDRSGGFGGSVGGGGMGANNDRGGGNAAAGLGSDRGGGNDRTGGLGPGGAGGGLGEGSGQSNSAAKGDMSTAGITGSKSDAPGITGAPEGPMDNIAEAAIKEAGLTASSLLGNNLSPDLISGMGMRSMAQTSPFGAMSPIGSTSEDVNAQNARNAIAGIVGGITAAPSGFAKNQDATIAGIVSNMSPAARVGQVGMPGLQVSNIGAKGDLAQTSISPQDLSSSQAMNNVPTREPVAPPAGLIGALPGELAARAQFGITSAPPAAPAAPVEAKTRSISRPGPSVSDISAANNALNSDIIGALNMENAPQSVNVDPASAPGFPAAPDPNADMGVVAPGLDTMPGFMENTATIPSNDYYGRFAPEPNRSNNFAGREPGGPNGGGGDRRYTQSSEGLLDALTPQNPASASLLQGQAPANLSPYHKSLWEYLYG